MEKAKKIFSRIMAVVSIVIFLFGLVIFGCVLNATAGKVPSVFGFSVLQVTTGSMEPELMTGSVIVVRKTDVNELKKGDVISFYSTDSKIAGKVNTHRIDSIEYGWGSDPDPIFITKGDANNSKDNAINKSQVVGKVVKILPYFGIILILVLLLYRLCEKKNAAIGVRVHSLL